MGGKNNQSNQGGAGSNLELYGGNQNQTQQNMGQKNNGAGGQYPQQQPSEYRQQENRQGIGYMGGQALGNDNPANWNRPPITAGTGGPFMMPQRPPPRPNPYMSGTPILQNPFLNDTPVFAGGSPTFDETQPTVGTGGPFITDKGAVGATKPWQPGPESPNRAAWDEAIAKKMYENAFAAGGYSEQDIMQNAIDAGMISPKTNPEYFDKNGTYNPVPYE